MADGEEAADGRTFADGIADARIVNASVARVDETMAEDGVRWLRRSDARRRCGVGRNILDLWVCDGKVEAHKLNPGKNGTVVFSAPDIDRAIRESPPYVPMADEESHLRGAACF